MVIKGNIRGNGGQLAQYLTRQGENDFIRILDVDGRGDGDQEYLFQTLEGMSLTEQLTRSRQGLYHAQINPAYEEDRAMTDEDWHKAADILEHALEFESQRRVIVLHEKKGRIHAHVVWERYDHDKGKMKPISHNYKAHDRARLEMERVFTQERTPERNKNRPELKELVTELWGETQSGTEFIKQMEEAGYMVASGAGKRPFMVVDGDGRSFDLVRQLKGVRTKEVRQRLKEVDLIDEKKAIELVRQRKEQQEKSKGQNNGDKKQNAPEPNEEWNRRDRVQNFAYNREDIFAGEKKKENIRSFKDTASDIADPHITTEQGARNFADNGHMTEKNRGMSPTPEMTSAKKTASSYAENRDNALSQDQIREQKKQALIAEMKSQLDRSWQKDREKERSM